jgi:hypothetical protein
LAREKEIMGAQDFSNEYHGDATMEDAYSEIVSQALWEHGHGGYTGTIGETRGVILDPKVSKPLTEEELQAHLKDWWDNEDGPQKWGPAWAIPLAPNPDWVDPYGGKYPLGVDDKSKPGWYFYGIASC